MNFPSFRRTKVFAVIALACGARALAFQQPQQPPLSNLDTRTKGVELPEQSDAAKELRARVPGVKIEFDPITASPKSVGSSSSFLTGPDGEGKAVSAKGAGAVAKGEAHRPTKLLLQEHGKLFGHGAEALHRARIKREFKAAHNGVTTVVWEQHVDNIEVFEAVFISHTTARGELINLSSQFVPDAERAVNRGTPRRAQILAAPPVSAALALKLAARNLDQKADDEPRAAGAPQGDDRKQKFTAPFLRGEADAKLVWLPMDRDTLRLCWDVTLSVRGRAELYRMLVDAQTGDVPVRRCLTEYLTNATFRVYTSDSPSPFSPGHPTPLTNQPPLVSRTLVTLPALDTNASPAGWIADGANETLGNNVDAHTDTDANNIPDLPRPSGSPFRVFDPPMDLLTQPGTYRDAAVVQLFYYCNWMHDKLYQLGFTEAAGNFQADNFGRGGVGNDALQADAQDGSGYNNANMSTPGDGAAPRMQMYVFNGPVPYRDGDFDGEIVLHEYTHGLSNRRVGGGIGLSALQSRGMGEGWSDWYGLALLSESSDNVNGAYAAGGYATYQFASPTYLQNYYFGIRRYPYSTDLSKNPLTFKDIDPTQASSHPGIPISPIFGGGGSASEVHNQGEVWCVTLWEARANLITKHGFAIGNQLILQLVTDAMNFSPPNPNFLQSRDAILQADLALTGGANRLELWAAFARRGMGANASSPLSSTTTGVIESFDMPDYLMVLPQTGFTSTGPVGGPFTVTAATFTLTNTGVASVNWIVVSTSSWLNVSSVSGTLAPGAAAATVNVSLGASASALPAGIYSASVRFTNLTSGIGTGREIILRVGQPDFFTELFESGDFDLGFTTVLLTPSGGPSFYSACREVATNFPTDPTGGTPLSLSDDSYIMVTLPATNTVSIYNRRTNVFYIGSNGYITMDYGDNEYYPTAAWHFNRPRLSMLFTDLDPGDGGQISWRQMSNRVAVTYANVPEYDIGGNNSFQLEMFFDGRIRMTWLGLTARYGVSGVSEGLGTPPGFVESDLSSYGSCAIPLLLAAPASATEGAGVLTNQGRVSLLATLTTNLTITLNSSDTSEIAVPASVIIPAGQTNATFDLTVIDDVQLDGTQVAALTASAPGFANPSTNIAVHDNETATLTVIAPATVLEGNGSTNGMVLVSAAVASDVNVQITSSDISAIQVQAIATIPAGQTSALFSITMPDDIRMDGPQTATITAHVQNWTDGQVTVTALDNESSNLVVVVPQFLAENSGATNAGVVQISGTLTTNLVVTLESSAPEQLAVPATVTIPAGQFGQSFALTLTDNGVLDGSRNVTLSASAPGFVTGARTVTIVDDESPPLPSQPTPADFSVNILFNPAQLAWFNGGSGISNDVYFGTSPTPGPAEFQGTVTSNTWPVPLLLAPNTTYYWQIVARKVGVTAGPVWRFTTRGVDHFTFNHVPSPQVANQPFPITITARDELNRAVSNFTGAVTLNAVPIGFEEVIESFESGTWPNGQWNSTLGGVVGTTYAHDGAFGLRDPGWSYRTNVSLGDGSSLSWWVRPSSSDSRAYLGFGASSAGCWSAVVAPNTSQFIIQRNPSYDFVEMTQSAQVWQLNHWYKVVVRFTSATSVTARVYDSDGTTLLNSLSYSGVDTLPGGVAIRSFGSFSLDTIGSSSGAGIAMTPTNSGAFNNGTWTGNVTVLQPATNLQIVATDTALHRGVSTNFNVMLQNDLSISLTVEPRVVSFDGFITNQITVVNSGPAAASNVVVEFDPGPLEIRDVEFPFGSQRGSAGPVTYSLGTLFTGSSTAFLVTRATALGAVTNTARVTRSGPDGYDGNNVAQVVSTILMPSVTIADIAVIEGNSGVTTANFNVRLFPPTIRDVTVSFATSNGTATAGSDYIATNGVVTFAAGQTNQVISVAVLGDTNTEPNETFTVTLLTATNAVTGNNSATGTILNDELLPYAYVRSVPGEPWGSLANIAALNRAFGVSNWQDLRFETANPLLLFSPTTTFIYLEGSDFQALALAAFIQSNKVAMENWVMNGGRLFINAAPNEGYGMDLGFGMSLVYPDGAESATAADSAHPIFNGPFTPVGTYFTGNSFTHASINGQGVALLTNVYRVLPGLVEKHAGNGLVLFGGMTTDNYHAPQPNASNLRANILVYTAAFVPCSNCPPQFLSQPASRMVKPGTNVSFTVAANGTAPLTFQWRRDGVDLAEGGRFTGTTNRTLVISNVTESDSGIYSVLASNAFGTSVSSNATLLISRLDHFAWSFIASPQIAGVPFVATIIAQDDTNGVATSFNGTVALSATSVGGSTVAIVPPVTSSFTNGVWAGEIAAMDPGTNVIVVATHWSGIAGQGGVFHVITSNQPPVVLTQPASQSVTNGQAVSFSVSVYGALPMNYQWKLFGTNLPGQTNESLTISFATTNDAGPYSVEVTNLFGATLSSNALLVVYQPGPLPLFRITALLTNGSRVVEHRNVTGDDRGGIAVSSQRVFYNGDAGVGRFALNDLSGGANIGWFYEALVTDLRSGNMYSLGDAAGPLTTAGGTITRLLEHDPVSGVLNGISVPLSRSISATSYGNVGIFAGYGCVVIHTGTRVYSIALPSGYVTDLGPLPAPVHSFAETWAYWGVAEHDSGTFWLVYVQDNQTITRVSVPGGQYQTVARFANLGDMAAISVSVPLNRWYFHHQYGSQFGGASETLGYASAAFAVSGTNYAPSFVLHPASTAAFPGNTVAFNALASGPSPLRYQWRKNGTNIFGATNTTLTLPFIQSTDAGIYSVVASNDFAGAVSSNAALTIQPPLGIIAVFDDPLYVDTGGTAESESDNVQATANSLGFSVVTITNLAAATNYRSILIPELENRDLTLDMAPSTRAALSNYVFNGGKLIVHGSYDSYTSRLLNFLFNFNVYESDDIESSHYRTLQAAGTEFGDDPLQLPWNDATSSLLISSLPAGTRLFYTNYAYASVAGIPVGTGMVLFLGWDWYDAAPVGSQDSGWARILDSALRQIWLPPVNPSGTPVVVFDDPFFVDTTNAPPAAESDNVQASLQFLQHLPVPTTDLLTAFTSGYGIVLIPEQERMPIASYLTPQTQAAVTNFVQQGGKLIIHGGSFGAGASFLNSTFGYALSETTITGTSVRGSAATGTLFTNGPATLTNYSLTTCLQPNTLPVGAYRIYTNGLGVTVALIERGYGQIIFLGWDWNNALPLGTNNGGWLNVLDAAVRQPPLPVHFTSVPVSQSVQPGTYVLFSASAIGPRPLRYQWKFNGTNIPGATAPDLIIPGADLYAHAGTYQVSVTDGSNSTVTASANLTVLVRPYVSNAPQPAVVLQGRDAQFSVTAGPVHPTLPLTYRWVTIGSPGTVTNATNSVLYVRNCQSNGTVRLSVINPAGLTNFYNIPLTVLADNDRDGIADSWEAMFGMNTNNAADALDDLDRDGMNNLGEYLCGTNPTNALSVLRLTLPSPLSTMYFDAESNRAYVVEVRTNVASGAWIPIQTFNPAATATRIHVSAPNPRPPEYYYRVWTPGTNGP